MRACGCDENVAKESAAWRVDQLASGSYIIVRTCCGLDRRTRRYTARSASFVTPVPTTTALTMSVASTAYANVRAKSTGSVPAGILHHHQRAPRACIPGAVVRVNDHAHHEISMNTEFRAEANER